MSDAAPNGNPNRDGDAHSEPDAYCHAELDEHPHLHDNELTDYNSDVYGHPQSNSDINADQFSQLHTDGLAYRYADELANEHLDPNPDPHPNIGRCFLRAGEQQ